ncbi:hypothetical protein QYZ43_00155 [Vibrio parahaemolyticus]|nr:hypothetical protein [Vibrio parahaemolyticus]MDN4720536.1 hypothetical protein [Vibrio parahaemolyticus]
MVHHPTSRFISCVLIVTMSLLPTHGYTNQPTNPAKTGREAQNFGLEMAAEFEQPSYEAGNVHFSGGEAINVNDLFLAHQARTMIR